MSEILYDTQYLQLKSTNCDNGKKWFYAHRPNALDGIVILPVTKEEILFLIEKRPPMVAEGVGTYSIALPAGLVGDERLGETVEEAAITELKEETGLKAEKIEIVAKNIASSPGCVSEIFTVAIAEITDKKIVSAPIDDGGIIIDRVWVKKDNIFNWISQKSKDGYILTAQSLAALYILFNGGNNL